MGAYKHVREPCLFQIPVLHRRHAEAQKGKAPGPPPYWPLTHNALEPLLEPLDRLVAVDAVARADVALAAAAAGDALAGAGHAAVEVHAVDADRRVVLDAEVDVLADAEAEVARLAEVALAQLVLLDLQAALQDLLRLGAANGDVDRDLLVAADAERADGVASLAWRAVRCPASACVSKAAVEGRVCRPVRTVDGRLAAQLLEHLGCSRQSVAGLADRDVQNELLDAELPHGVVGLFGLEAPWSVRGSQTAEDACPARLSYHGDGFLSISRRERRPTSLLFSRRCCALGFLDFEANPFFCGRQNRGTAADALAPVWRLVGGPSFRRRKLRDFAYRYMYLRSITARRGSSVQIKSVDHAGEKSWCWRGIPIAAWQVSLGRRDGESPFHYHERLDPCAF